MRRYNIIILLFCNIITVWRITFTFVSCPLTGISENRGRDDPAHYLQRVPSETVGKVHDKKVRSGAVDTRV